jgi:hypothetical protein
VASETELEAYYKVNIKLIGESYEDFAAEHRDRSIQEITAKYQALIELGKRMNQPGWKPEATK